MIGFDPQSGALSVHSATPIAWQGCFPSIVPCRPQLLKRFVCFETVFLLRTCIDCRLCLLFLNSGTAPAILSPKQVAVRPVVVVPTAEGFFGAGEEFQAGNALDMAVAKSDVVVAAMPLLDGANDVRTQRLNSLP